MAFKLTSKYKPTGDQPNAIKGLVNGINRNDKYQVLLGVTGSGKTFTIANVIQQVQKPTLVLLPSHLRSSKVSINLRGFSAARYF